MMRIITHPTVEPVTLAEVRAQIGITDATDTASDAIIKRRITEARQYAEEYMHRAIVIQTQEIRLDDFPRGYMEDSIKLPFPDLLSIASIKYIDSDGVEQTISSSDYVVDTHNFIGSVRPAYGTSWPSPRNEPDAVRVRYACGYTSSALAAAKTITGATNASPGVFTSAGHGFADGDIIEMQTTGMTVPDGLPYRVYAKTTDTFQLANLANDAGLSTTSWGTFATGTAQKVELNVPPLIRESILLTVGHLMNNQPQAESGVTISRMPWAVRDLLDTYRVLQIA